MIIPVIVFTSRDLVCKADSFNQEIIVKSLKINKINVLYYVDLALYKISENDYVVIKCIESDLVNWRVPKEMALKLLKQFTGRLL